MKNKTYYLPKYYLLVYVHDDDGETLTIGGMTRFISDSVTCVLRQSISVKGFIELEPVEISKENASTLPFMVMSAFDIGWRTEGNPYSSGYLKEARQEPSIFTSAPITPRIGNYDDISS